MSGEQIAIKLQQPVAETEEDDSDDNSLSISFIEPQDNSILLSNQLKMRFGVKSGDYILIITNGNTGAEITAMLSAMRLDAIFVPLSIQIEMDAIRECRLQSIISLVAPTAAILEQDRADLRRHQKSSKKSSPRTDSMLIKILFECDEVEVAVTLMLELAWRSESDRAPSKDPLDSPMGPSRMRHEKEDLRMSDIEDAVNEDDKLEKYKAQPQQAPPMSKSVDFISIDKFLSTPQ